MNSPVLPEQRLRRASLVLVLALIPMLTFMGHWPRSFDIPGTQYYVGAFRSSPGHTQGAEDTETHSSHCHGDSASCSDVPATAGVSFGLMGEAIALAVAAGALVAVAAGARAAVREKVFAPEPRPPRAVVSLT